MNDLVHASTFFTIFALMLVLYGAVLAATGNVGLLPRRASLSIKGPDDVRRVGRIVLIVGAVIGAIALVVGLVSR